MSSDIQRHLLSIERKLDRVLSALGVVSQKEDHIMALADDLKAGIAELNTETDAVAGVLASLAGRIKNSLSDQEVKDIKAALGAESDRLKTLAVDPTAPVPPTPPTLAAVRARK